jgi:hypothetical protein
LPASCCSDCSILCMRSGMVLGVSLVLSCGPPRIYSRRCNRSSSSANVKSTASSYSSMVVVDLMVVDVCANAGAYLPRAERMLILAAADKPPDFGASRPGVSGALQTSLFTHSASFT